MMRILAALGDMHIVWRNPTMLIAGAIISAALIGIWIAYLVILRRIGGGARIAEFDSHAYDVRRVMQCIGALAFLTGIIMGFLAAAEPLRKTKVPLNIYEGACHGIALDASFSMAAPVERNSKETRLGLAIRTIEALVEGFPEGDRFTFMVFAGTPHIFRPIWTADRERIFLPKLRSINKSYLAVYGRDGSNIPAAIGAWLKVLRGEIPCQPFIFVFTDGEPEGDEKELDQGLVNSLESFSQLKNKVTIFMVAIGDYREELRIPEYDLNGEFAGFAVNKKGKFVFSKPNLAYLQEIASRFRARLLFADKGDDLKKKVSSEVEQVRKIAAVEYKESYVPVSQVFTLLFLFFVVGSIVILTL